MGVALLILLLIIGLLIGNLARIAFGHNHIANVLAFIVVFIVSALVTYTPDWAGYESWITEDIGRDVFFNFFVHQILPEGWGYQFVHIFFISCYTIILLYLISQFTNQSYMVFLMYLGIVYLYYTTQIRFFMGYYAISLAFYFWFVEQKLKPALFFLVFAVLNHASLLFFLPFIYFFRINVETLIKRVFLLLFVVVGIYFVSSFFFTEESEQVVFLTYLASDDHESTLLGGLFTFLPSLIGFLFIHLYSRDKISEYPQLLNDKKFQYLYRFIVISIIFVGIALERQVIGQRFIIPASIFQILLLFYLAHYNERRQNVVMFGAAAAFYMGYLFYHYVLSLMITSSNMSMMVVEMLRTNMLVRFFLE